MTVDQVNLPARRSATSSGLRMLGIMGMICAPMMLAEAVYRYVAHLADNEDPPVIGLLGAIYIGGWMCSATGMRRLRVMGNGIWSMAVFIVQMMGLLLAWFWSVQEIFKWNFVEGSLLFNIGDAAWPLSHLFMLVVGCFLWKAGVWRGLPRRLAPFLCGL